MSDSEKAYWRNLRQMTPAQKFAAWNSLYWTAREIKAAGIRMRYPELTEEVQQRVREIFMYATTD